MKISVIVPVYNSEKYIDRCINSILLQTHEDWELILVDDGSTDLSLSILNEYQLHDDRIIVIHQDNAGPGIARNTGIRIATGEYVVFVDSDDFIDKDYLRLLSKKNDDVVFIDVNQVDESNRLIKTEYMSDKIKLTKDQFLRGQMTGKIEWGGVRKAVRLGHLRKHNILYSNHKIGEEAIFSFKALYYAESFSFIEVPVYTYINREGSQSDYKADDPWGPVVKLLRDNIKEMGCYSKYADTLNAFLITSNVVSLDRIAQRTTLIEFLKCSKQNRKKYKLYIDKKYKIDFLNMPFKARMMSLFVIVGLYSPVYIVSKIKNYKKYKCKNK